MSFKKLEKLFNIKQNELTNNDLNTFNELKKELNMNKIFVQLCCLNCQNKYIEGGCCSQSWKTNVEPIKLRTLEKLEQNEKECPDGCKYYPETECFGNGAILFVTLNDFINNYHEYSCGLYDKHFFHCNSHYAS